MSLQTAQPAAVTPPKRHHFVPKFLIEQFAGDAGTVRAWFKAQETVRDVLPKDLFVVGQFHSLYRQDGSRDPTLEVQLARLEGMVSPVIDEILVGVRGNQVVDITVEQKTVVDLFIYLQFRRTPERFERYRADIGFDELLRSSIAAWRREHPEQEHELEGLPDAEIEKRVFHNSRIKAIRHFKGPVLDAFRRRYLDIVHIDPRIRRQFVLGSTPVMPFEGLIHPGETQLWLPIAPDIAIGPGPLGNGFRQIMIRDPEVIRRFNMAICAQSSIVAAASDRLLQSLRRPR
ncbi:DUF4238 domain-containing protein [Aureimonas sp. N4]|uniref:DUF4238 domain-containing protein n=1 Tax=Aureimonas sp. N4 TaxID=1638165 RepID=UPI0007818B7B|nr:DUF4238 domain-containing protein [Aureimonas sp. N4]